MKSLFQKLNNTPYWLLSIIISLSFGVVLFVVFTIEGGLETGISISATLTALSILGFGIVRFTMPAKKY